MRKNKENTWLALEIILEQNSNSGRLTARDERNRS
jgi:hypothetical protein